eukprot:m.351506 g.351506  ORF g.351506 m.351506 type:complete len:86 (-) comp16264_c0_seq1:369-626(-)
MAGRFLAKNPALYPLAVVTGLAMSLSAGYLIRATASGHQAAWTKASVYPWQNIRPTQNIKLMALQSADEKDVFKPRAADDLRGRF